MGNYYHENRCSLVIGQKTKDKGQITAVISHQLSVISSRKLTPNSEVLPSWTGPEAPWFSLN